MVNVLMTKSWRSCSVELMMKDLLSQASAYLSNIRMIVSRSIFLTLLCLLTSANLVGSQPNVLIVFTDDQRADAVGYASEGRYQTPDIDRLAEHATQFTHAYAAFALCSPSRAALMTGQYGSRNGVNGLGGAISDPSSSLAYRLRENGYSTAVSGKWHLKNTPAEVGFDWSVIFHSNGTWYGRKVDRNGEEVRPEELVDLYCANESVRFLRERDQSKPFFLWHCSQLPHMDGKLTWPASEKNKAAFDPDEIPLPKTWEGDYEDKPAWVKKSRNRSQAVKYGYGDDPQAIRAHIRDYKATMLDLDDALAPIWNELDAQGLWENTLVIFLSDNGWMLAEHGLTSKVLAYEPSVRVPMLVAMPGQTESAVCDELVANIDIAPTVLDYLDLDVAEKTQGKSFMPLLEDPVSSGRDGFLYEGIGGYGGVPPMGAWITHRYKVIQSWKEGLDKEPTFVEVYDAKKDADETRNLAKRRKTKRLRSEAAEALQEHFEDL